MDGGNGEKDPLLQEPPSIVREEDYIILVFADGRKIFAQALTNKKGKTPPVKINKRSYPTANLIGLSYGTVLELGMGKLDPLPEGEDIIPDYPASLAAEGTQGLESEEANTDDGTFPSMNLEQKNDNRNLVDNNKSQKLQLEQIEKMRQDGTHGSDIVEKLIENSATFDQKTEFSKAKYIKKKQQKYQQRCRIVRCTPYSICEAVFASRPKLLLNMRDDTLGQMLSHANVSAGCQVLLYEHCAGVLTGALAWRMGGYGKILSVYEGQQPSFLEMLRRYNLSFAENSSIKWLHVGDIYGESNANDPKEIDVEKEERDSLEWPCPLQNHTRGYLDEMKTIREKRQFLAKRCARFTRKLTRQTPMESKKMLEARKSDSIIIAVRHDPTETLLGLLPYLATSSPFVVYCEYIEPLTECFMELQKRKLAINLRLSDTWMREYQVLQGRTHPSMSMTQSGGFILTGTKLCPDTGHNELSEELMQELRLKVGGRRGKKKKPRDGDGEGSNAKKKLRCSQIIQKISSTMKQFSTLIAVVLLVYNSIGTEAFVANTRSSRSAVITSSRLAAGPLQKFSNPKEYNKVVENLMFTRGITREEAVKEYDAYLNNPNDYALNKGEAYYKSLGYKSLMDGVIGEAEKEGRGDEVRARIEKFNQESKAKGLATISFFIALGFYLKITHPYVPPLH